MRKVYPALGVATCVGERCKGIRSGCFSGKIAPRIAASGQSRRGYSMLIRIRLIRIRLMRIRAGATRKEQAMQAIHLRAIPRLCQISQ